MSLKPEPSRNNDANAPSSIGQIVSILLKTGTITQKQFDYARRIQSKLETPGTMLDVLKELKYLTADQISDIIRNNYSQFRIGDLLVELGYITERQLKICLKAQAADKGHHKLGELLVAHNFIREKQLLEILSVLLRVPLIDVEFVKLDRNLATLAHLKLFKEFKFIPIRRDGEQIVVAFADPGNPECVKQARALLESDIIPCIARERSIIKVIDDIQNRANSFSTISIPDISVVDIVNTMILDALNLGISDIHIEPISDRLRVRFRQDGVLIHYQDFPRKIIPSLTSRIKVMCSADIAERRRHQGGRIDFNSGEDAVDLRVSFYVTVHGEKIVMRLLRRQAHLLAIDDVGMAPRMLDRFKTSALDCPSGVVLVTGPTGSGKTTTVYSCINHLNRPDVSIITAEEPVEYVVDGIAQCSIDPKINLTFNETLRHIVRQDPDVVVIGEIRDTFSAQVAVQAALTGHKVLTTFHTEDSIGGLVRLMNMEVDVFLISSTVVCVLAQRLLRKVCPACTQPYHVTPTDLRLLTYSYQDIHNANFQQGFGCSKCAHTGYKGRLGVHEMLILDEAVRNAILEKKTSYQIRKIGIESTGLVTLLETGVAMAATGATTLQEVFRCLPRLHKPRSLPVIQNLLGI